MSVSLREATNSDAESRWISSVYDVYLKDLAPAGTGHFPLLKEVGHRGPDLLASSLADKAVKVLTVMSGRTRAGFAIVRRAGAASDPQPEYTLSEFFVATEWRGRGIGQAAARLIFDRFAGRWHIVENSRNFRAVRFWKRVVANYTGGKYRERSMGGEVHQHFESAPRRSV